MTESLEFYLSSFWRWAGIAYSRPGANMSDLIAYYEERMKSDE